MLDATFYGFDPHFYGWPTPSFQARWTTSLPDRLRWGSGGRPIINYRKRRQPGRSQRQDEMDRGDVRSGGVEHAAPRFLFATWWDRAGVVIGKAVDERFDSSPESLTGRAATLCDLC